jgi:hypothetical protein
VRSSRHARTTRWVRSSGLLARFERRGGRSRSGLSARTPAARPDTRFTCLTRLRSSRRRLSGTWPARLLAPRRLRAIDAPSSGCETRAVEAKDRSLSRARPPRCTVPVAWRRASAAARAQRPRGLWHRPRSAPRDRPRRSEMPASPCHVARSAKGTRAVCRVAPRDLVARSTLSSMSLQMIGSGDVFRDPCRSGQAAGATWPGMRVALRVRGPARAPGHVALRDLVGRHAASAVSHRSPIRRDMQWRQRRSSPRSRATCDGCHVAPVLDPGRHA